MRYKNHTTQKTQSNTYRIYNPDNVHVGTIQETKNYKNHPGLQRYTAKGTKNNPEYANRTAYGKKRNRRTPRLHRHPQPKLQTPLIPPLCKPGHTPDILGCTPAHKGATNYLTNKTLEHSQQHKEDTHHDYHHLP